MVSLNGNATGAVGKMDRNIPVLKVKAYWKCSRSGGIWSTRVKWDMDWMQQPSGRLTM
jgi:hypothetical protein